MTIRFLPLLAGAAFVSAPALGQVIDPFFASTYSFADLGSVPEVPANYGGLTLLPSDPNTLIIGGAANSADGKLYSVGVTRDIDGHITGFSGAATVYAEAPYNDGGVVFGPGGVLFASRWPVNELGQYRPGSTAPDKVINLADLGVAGSHSALNFVPAGYPGAGRMKLVSYGGGQFYDANFTPDGTGLFDITMVTQTASIPGGPEGFAYVPTGSPLFTSPTMILSEYASGNVVVYDMNSNGDPVEASRRVFMSGLSGAEGAFIDPLTGDFMFSTFGGGNRVIVVRGFVPAPGALIAFGTCGVLAMRRRR